MAQRRKTTEEIQKANLKRVMGKIKIEVADKEELWLEVLMNVIPMCTPMEKSPSLANIDWAVVANYVLEKYEERWGV